MTPAASTIADNELQGLMRRFGEQAVAAQATLARSTSASRDAALREAARAVRRQTADILAANAEDMADGEQKGLSAAMLDRLRLDGSRLEAIARGLEQIAALPDPLGRVLAEDVISPVDVPSNDNSAMDGYAVRLSDLTAGTPLIMAGKAFAGQP